MERIELLPGVYLRAIQAEKFKTACFSVNFLQPLTKQLAPVNALLPSVLLRGTQHYPTIRDISAHLDDCYGASFGTLVRKRGDIVTSGFYADFIEDQFTPDAMPVFSAMTDFLAELLFAPCRTADGQFLPAFVEGERQNLCNAIAARINDKRSYAVWQLLAAMCADEPYGIPRLGDLETAQAVTPEALQAHYETLLRSAPVELFYMGRQTPEAVAEQMTQALSRLPNRQVQPVSYRPMPGTPTPRTITEQLDVTQGKLCIGLRTNCDGADEPAFVALQLLNVIFGSGINSKLFLHVREELGLCYYASSSLERCKGIMLISSGIDFSQFGAAQDAILQQLDACKQGQITWDELETARRYLRSAWRASLDAPGRIDDFYLGQAICRSEATIEDRIALLEHVTLQQVIDAANRIVLDTVYFLKGAEA